jgi:hypothetical protein
MGYKTWPPRFLLKGGAKSPHGSFGRKDIPDVAVRAGGGAFIDGQLGAELTLTGDFGADANWTKDAGWAIAAGVATATATATNAFLHQAITLISGRMYKVVFTITAYTSGNVAASFDVGQTGTGYAATGTFTDYLIAGAAAAEIRFGRKTADFTGSIDNVSVKLVG